MDKYSSQLVFVNDDIFTSDGDYVIGGFVTDKKDNYNLSDFEENLSIRLSKLIDNYLDRATLFNVQLGLENPDVVAKEDLALLLKDNLGYAVAYTNKETVIKSIIDYDKTQSWILKINQNIQDFEPFQAESKFGVYNQAAYGTCTIEQYETAQYFTEEISLEEVIEQISMIEL
jgi:hypothetical protein